MSLVFNTPALRDAVNWVAQRLPNKPTQPVELAVVIDPAGGGTLPIAVSSGGEDARAHAPIAEGTTPEGMKRVGLPGKALEAAVNASRGDTITLEFTDKGATVRSAGAKFKLPYMNLDEHPMGAGTPLAELPETQFSLSAEQMRWVVGNTTPVVEGDMGQPAMTGVKFVLGDNRLKAAGLNNYALATADMPLEGAPEETLLFPSAILKAVTSHIPKHVEKVNFRWDGDNPSKVYLSIPGRAIALGMLAEKEMFPAYEAIIPQMDEAESVFVTVADDFKDAMKQATTVADEGTGDVTLTGDDNGVSLKTTGKMFAYDGKIEASLIGDHSSIAVPLKRLSLAVDTLKGDLLVVARAGNRVRITAADAPDGDADNQFLQDLETNEGPTALFVVMCRQQA